jgi:hypothetical protein
MNPDARCRAFQVRAIEPLLKQEMNDLENSDELNLGRIERDIGPQAAAVSAFASNTDDAPSRTALTAEATDHFRQAPCSGRSRYLS